MLSTLPVATATQPQFLPQSNKRTVDVNGKAKPNSVLLATKYHVSFHLYRRYAGDPFYCKQGEWLGVTREFDMTPHRAALLLALVPHYLNDREKRMLQFVIRGEVKPRTMPRRHNRFAFAHSV